MGDKYILVDGKPVMEPGLMKWANWLEVADRVIAKESIVDGSTGNVVKVSTVFLGIDHNFGGGKPVLCETMVFGGPNDGYQARWHTIEDAKLGHQGAVAMEKGRIGQVAKFHRDAFTVKPATENKKFVRNILV